MSAAAEPSAEELDQSNEYRQSLRVLEGMLGPAVMRLIREPLVTDILVRPEWMSATYRGQDRRLVAGHESVSVVGALRVIAAMQGARVGTESPRVGIGIPEWSARIIGTHEGPYGVRSTLSIRVHRAAAVGLPDFLGMGKDTMGVLSDYMLDRQERRGVLVSGIPGSGKTTFLRALLRLIPEEEHIVVAEDIRELNLPQPMVTVHEVTRWYSYRDAMADVRREEPDRVVLQEIIGAEAREVVSCGIAGIPPYSTIHAYSVSNALAMVEQRALEGGADNAVTKEEIAKAFGLCVQMRRSKAGFAVESIRRITYAHGGYQLEPVF